MKRSEMVKIINKEILAQQAGHHDVDCDLLLSVIEAAGMLPPFSYNLYEDYEFGTDTRSYCEWEPEEDES